MTAAIEAAEAPASPGDVQPGLLRSKVLKQPQTIVGLTVLDESSWKVVDQDPSPGARLGQGDTVRLDIDRA